MKLTFTRGTLVKAVEQNDSTASSLAFFWLKHEPEGFLNSGEGPLTLALQKSSDDLYLGYHESVGTIAIAKTPWWTELPSLPSDRGVWLSYQGFSQGVWHDGIFGRFEDGAWTDLVLQGAPFLLAFGRSRLALENVDEFWKEEKFFSMKQSLIEAVKAYFGVVFQGSKIVLQANGSDTDLVLNLLLLRLSYPSTRFAIFPKDVGWKRLAQNLNIDILKEKPEGEGFAVIRGLGPKEKILDLIRWQQSRSPFIPANLLKSLCD